MIWDLLMDDQSRIIGVYGMTGMGKTAIMMNVYNQLLDTQSDQFDEVIWVSVSRNPSMISNCWRHIEKLIYRNRLVLIVDGILKVEDANRIKREYSKRYGCKLVFTTRSLNMCTRMGCEEYCCVEVELLSETEALELFWDTVKVKGNPTPRMADIAEEVVKVCSRLPLAIVDVGKKFKRKYECGWAKLLLKIKNSDYGIMDDFAGVRLFLDLMFSDIELCEAGDILNLCVLYPKDWKILTKEWIEYSHMLRRVCSESNEVEQSLMSLISNTYLERVAVDFEDYHEWGEGVKIQPLYRDFTFRYSSRMLISKCGLMLKKLPDEAKWSEYITKASFMCNNIETISISPNCPNLSILFLNKNHDLCTISHQFFVHMISLRILDLRDNHKMETLPDSVSDLLNLRALRLSRCRSLKRVPSLAKLLHMEMLELDETAIEELPHGIEMLVELRVLKLHSLRLREAIPNDYLSMLRSLPHLQLHL